MPWESLLLLLFACHCFLSSLSFLVSAPIFKHFIGITHQSIAQLPDEVQWPIQWPKFNFELLKNSPYFEQKSKVMWFLFIGLSPNWGMNKVSVSSAQQFLRYMTTICILLPHPKAVLSENNFLLRVIISFWELIPVFSIICPKNTYCQKPFSIILLKKFLISSA